MPYAATDNIKAPFITIEGIEGVGKSTACKFIISLLQQANIDYVATREPGGTPIAEDVRNLLLQEHSEPMSETCELLLMFASRAQHLERVIWPAMQQDKWVVCDRFIDATYAYQGGGRQLAQQPIQLLEQCLSQAAPQDLSLTPDLTILLDAPVELGLQRAKRRSAPDRFEQEATEFFTRVRAQYLHRAEQEPQRFRIIDAAQPLAKVQAAIRAVFTESFAEHFSEDCKHG